MRRCYGINDVEGGAEADGCMRCIIKFQVQMLFHADWRLSTIMSLPSCDDPGPFTRSYSELQSDLLTLGRSGLAPELAAFISKHKFSSVDAAFPHAFGHHEDRCVCVKGCGGEVTAVTDAAQAAALCGVLQQFPTCASFGGGLSVRHSASHPVTGAAV